MNYFYRAISLTAIFWTTVSMSAYTPHETGSRITASGAKAQEGYTCAANFVPLGSVIIYEGHKYVVQDRMNPKYNSHVDLFMESHKKALQFGRKEARVQVMTKEDKHPKLRKEDEPLETKDENTKKQRTADAKKHKNAETKSSNSMLKAPAVMKPQARP